MSFTRVNPSSWGFGQVLTSAQMNTLDTDHSNSIDKRVGALEVDSHTVIRTQPLIPMQGASGTNFEHPGDWYWDDAALMWRVNDATTGISSATFALTNIPARSSLTKIRFFVKGTGFTTVPNSLNAPIFVFRYLDTAGAVQTPAPGSVDDLSVLGTFNTYHSVEITLSSPLAINLTTTPINLFGRCIYDSNGSSGGGRTYHLGSIECEFTVDRLTPG